MQKLNIVLFLLGAMASVSFLYAEAGYFVILKDGTVISAQASYETKGDIAIIRRAEGDLVSVSVAYIDIARTEAANSSDAIVLYKTPVFSASSSPKARSAEKTPAETEVMDNTSLSRFRHIKLNEAEPEASEEGEEEESAAAGKAPPAKSDIYAKEDALKKMVDAINQKVGESQKHASNYQIQKRLEKEVEDLKSQYDAEWQNYKQMVDGYNADVRGEKPPPPAEETEEFGYEETAEEESYEEETSEEFSEITEEE